MRKKRRRKVAEWRWLECIRERSLREKKLNLCKIRKMNKMREGLIRHRNSLKLKENHHLRICG